MGRHSAPDDDNTAEGTAVATADVAADAAAHTAAEAAAEAAGRHAVRSEDATDTGPLPGGPIPPGEEPAAQPDERPPPAKRPHSTQSSSADLALIRRHPDVRNRVLGAVVVPFVLYAAVLLLLAAPALHFLIWAWIPLVTAGVLAGFVLDAAHKRYPDQPAD